MNQGELQHFARNFPALYELTEQASRPPVDFIQLALDGVGLFEKIRNDCFRFDSRIIPSLQRNLHTALSPPILIHRVFRFSASFLGAFVLTAVPGFLSFRPSEFNFGDSSAEVNM